MGKTISDASDKGGRSAHQAAAAHARKMYDRISALAKIGVWEYDLQAEQLIWTDTVYDLFGLPRGSPLVRSDIVDLYEAGSREEMERLRKAAIEQGIGFTLDIKIRTPAGEDRWIRLTADVEQENGRPARIFGTKQDITAERASQDRVQSLQTELIHASRAAAMGAMASTLAHEVNQPLAAAANYLAGARRRAEATGDAELGRSVDAALSATLRAGETIRRLRTLFGKDQANRSRVEVGPLATDAANMVMAGSPSCSISLDLAAAAPVRGDRIQIQQVLISLLRNACEAVETGAVRILIAARKAGPCLEIRVSDDGPGISEPILPDMFEAFVTSKPGGVGIGLSVARTIVEAHGGRIRGANRPKGGASISFTLPLWDDDQARTD